MNHRQYAASLAENDRKNTGGSEPLVMIIFIIVRRIS